MSLIPNFFALVEGDDDEKLIRIILKQCFEWIIPEFIKYSELKVRSVKQTVNIFHEQNDNYIMLADFDQYSCISGKRQSRMKKYGVKQKRTFVVKNEIEGWYIAGEMNNKFNIDSQNTENLTKKEFDSIISPSRHSYVLGQLALNFDSKLAMKNSSSFKYFYKKLKKLIPHHSKRQIQRSKRL